MHELPIVEATLKEVLSLLERHQAKKVVSVKLTLGEYSGFVDESIEFYWSIVTKGTKAESSTLEIKRRKGTMTCETCHHKYHHPIDTNICPQCGSHKLHIIDGSGYELTGIKVA